MLCWASATPDCVTEPHDSVRVPSRAGPRWRASPWAASGDKELRSHGVCAPPCASMGTSGRACRLRFLLGKGRGHTNCTVFCPGNSRRWHALWRTAGASQWRACRPHGCARVLTVPFGGPAPYCHSRADLNVTSSGDCRSSVTADYITLSNFFLYHSGPGLRLGVCHLLLVCLFPPTIRTENLTSCFCVSRTRARNILEMLLIHCAALLMAPAWCWAHVLHWTIVYSLQSSRSCAGCLYKFTVPALQILDCISLQASNEKHSYRDGTHESP